MSRSCSPLARAGILPCAALLVVGCGGSSAPERTGATVTGDSLGVEIVTSDLSRTDAVCSVAAEPRLVIGDREGDPTHELYRVFGGTLLDDGRLALVDQGSQQLRIYSAEGDLLAASGREGEGPGEFMNAFLLYRLPGDTLWVGDYRPWAWEIFDATGSWLRGVRPEPLYPNSPRQIVVLPDGRTVLAAQDATERDMNFGMTHLIAVLHDRDGATVDTLGRFEYGRYGQTVDDPYSVWLSPWFEPRSLFASSGARVAIAHGGQPEIRLHDVGPAGLELARIIRWSGVDLEVTEERLAALVDETVSRYADMDPAMRAQLVDPLVSDARPVADAIPSGTSILEGRDGTLWVAQHPTFSEEGSRRWLGFDAAGPFTCTLTTPPGLQVYEFGPDWVVGKRETDLGIETVVVFDLIR